MDTFSAVPSIVRLPITILDTVAYEEWLQREDLTVDSTPPTITKIFIAYEKGPGTPVPVQIEVDKIVTEYLSQRPTDQERKAMTPAQMYDRLRRTNMLFRRNLLLAVIRGLDPDDANVLASEDGSGRLILERLGYLRPADSDEDEAEDDTGEDQTVNETGE